MSLNNIKKQIEKISEAVEDYKGPDRHVFLITDSKGRYLSRHLQRRDFLQVIWRSGARIGDEDLKIRLKLKLRGLPNPVVLVWLGTCDFTEKGARSRLALRDVTADSLMSFLLDMKTEIMACNSTSQILFLHCPVYSIRIWNAAKGVPAEGDNEADNALEQVVSTFNNAVDEHNECYTPKFSLDLLRNTKVNKGQRSKYKFHFNELYIDGIHPSEELAQLWLWKIKKLVMKLS